MLVLGFLIYWLEKIVVFLRNGNIVIRELFDFISLLVFYKLDEGSWVFNIFRRKFYYFKGL